MVTQIDRGGQIRLAFALDFFHMVGCMSQGVYTRYWELLEDTSTFSGNRIDDLQAHLDKLSVLHEDKTSDISERQMTKINPRREREKIEKEKKNPN